MRPYIVGNWKMNGLQADLPEISAIDAAAAEYNFADVAISPPATLLHSASQLASNIAIGAQDSHAAESGAHTGCLSPTMIKEAGASFAIVGHSERRMEQRENDANIAAKAAALQQAKMGAIICVGEPLAEREAGCADEFVREQLKGSLDSDITSENLSIAYEPIWAIGTGKVAELSDIAEMHDNIRQQLVVRFGETASAIRILYGGSVKPQNAEAILALADVGGALVGGASLLAEHFVPIIKAAAPQ